MVQARLATLADIDTLVALMREFYAESGFEVGETNTPALALYTRYGLQAGTGGRLLLTRRLETDG